MAKFTEHEVVPDVLSAAPASVAEVVWPSGAKAEQGNVLTPTQVCKLLHVRKVIKKVDNFFRFRMSLL